ncbi:MAG: glycosyltransferase family 1 protein [Pseudomonadota bacterium]|nr:glycosyltransferase family 1 protein [Pseudomonadota bacterium]
MIVCVDGVSLTRPLSGIGRVAFEICRRLVNCQDISRLIVACPGPLNVAFKEIETYTQIRRCGRNTWYGLHLSRLLHNCDPDIFFSPSHRVPVTTPRHTFKHIMVHDLVWAKLPETMRPFARFYEPILFRHAVKQADHITAVSKSTANDLLEAFPGISDKVSISPLASSFVEQGRQKSGDYILFVGTFEPRKNIPYLLDGYANLPDEIKKDFELVLAGADSWGHVDVSKEIRNRNLQNFVSLKKEPTEKQLIQLYKNCAFLVLPSLYEGFGLPIVEAMSFGKPVITSNISSLPEVAGQAGLLVNPYEPNQMTQAMHALLTDGNLYLKLSDHALQRSKSFTWDHISSDLVQNFRRSVEQSQKN